MSQTFIKRPEDFTCGQCGVLVVGDGYTNHCPRCLYSQHVDIHPGDRLAECRGLMEPIAIERWHGTDRIIHRCLKCHHQNPNRVAENDDLAVVSALLLQSGV
ncbi:MAG: RNHCP domain-containing protein [Candidatus Vogelbacteria bacterium]